MTVKLKHPQAKKTINVRPDQVEMYESQGWVKDATPAKVGSRPRRTRRTS